MENSGCIPDRVCSTSSLSVCDADSTASDTENPFIWVVHGFVAVCNIRKFQNEHCTELFFLRCLLQQRCRVYLLLCDLDEITYKKELFYRKCDQEFIWAPVCELQLVCMARCQMQDCYISSGDRSIISGSVQSELWSSTSSRRCPSLAEHSQKHSFNLKMFIYLQFTFMNTLYTESSHSATGCIN